MTRPILVLGPPRSGTSWLASMLYQPAGHVSVREPDNWTDEIFAFRALRGLGDYISAPLDRRDQWTLWDAAFGRTAPPSRARAEALRWIQRVFTRTPWQPRFDLQRGYRATVPWWIKAFEAVAVPIKTPVEGQRPVVKSVHSLWVAEQLVERYDPHVVVIQRNPIEAMPSWLRLNFGDFAFFEQPDVRARFLEPEGIEPWADGASPEERAAWTYAVIDRMATRLVERHPEWLAVTHEHLVAEPTTGFAQVFEHCDITVDDATLRDWLAAGRDSSGTSFQLTRSAEDLARTARDRLPAETVDAMERVFEGFERGR